MGAVLALLAALTWGTGDYLGGVATKRQPVVTVAASAQIGGLAVVMAAAFLIGGSPAWEDLFYPGLGGAAGAVGLLLLYHGLATGTASVVAPITGVMSAAIPTVWGFINGESVSPTTSLGLFAGLIAIALISQGGDASQERSGLAGPSVLVALASGTSFGLFIVALSVAGDDAGLFPILAARAISVPLLILLAIASAQPVTAELDRLVILGAGIFDAAANALVLVALRDGVIVATVLSSMYPAATILWARLFEGERMRPAQKFGLLLAAAAVILIVVG
ncbi:MAG: DMT family transporter [Actinobacteria bacterium]|nr:DMT family transporter [Actinomycetota bacterium]